MQVDGAQQSQSTASDRQQDGHSMPGPDLKPQEGVGRCYYTQLPRLVKVRQHLLCLLALFTLWQQFTTTALFCLQRVYRGTTIFGWTTYCHESMRVHTSVLCRNCRWSWPDFALLCGARPSMSVRFIAC